MTSHDAGTARSRTYAAIFAATRYRPGGASLGLDPGETSGVPLEGRAGPVGGSLSGRIGGSSR
ncbi:hypothetical protein [Streptomyces sp. NPDC053367]|uniref:hypothetical protein n=1 Tax=Streptomyces sp. NPDC053367 TaxID=3365700 RepID=UPI0037D666B8